jgi:predicted nucleic acid-binding protein
MVILDTNIIIDYLRSQSTSSPLQKIVAQISKTNLAVSVITLQELYSGLSTRNKNNERIIWEILAPLRMLPYSTEVAKVAGTIVRDCDNMEFADAAIAATAIENGADLFTLNIRHFQGIPKLSLFQFV